MKIFIPVSVDMYSLHSLHLTQRYMILMLHIETVWFRCTFTACILHC